MPFLAGVFDSVAEFLYNLGSYLTFDIILYIFIALEAVVLIFFTIRAQFAYEVNLLRALDNINAYLYKAQYINENNLVDFNRMMKEVPDVLRYHWQQYMLYRDKKPSEYMSIYNCIELPAKSSTYTTSIKTLNYLSWIIAALGFIVSAAYLASFEVTVADFFFRAPLIPIVILIFNTIFVMTLKLRQASSTEDLYQVFKVFNMFIDKATTTLPEYVDFEVLFTKKEIKKGIPVLYEYIEKRRLQEQEELRLARERAIELQVYNFDEADEKGTLILDRAMKESEIFLNARSTILSEIGQKESELEGYKKNYDTKSRDLQKKLQAVKENVERLREQQEATTNRVEINYITKQIADEIKKQKQYEKDLGDEANRYKHDTSTLVEDIKKLETQLEASKDVVEKSMLAEYRTFALKIYREINSKIEEKVAAEKEELIEARARIRREYEEALQTLENILKENENLRKQLNMPAQTVVTYAEPEPQPQPQAPTELIIEETTEPVSVATEVVDAAALSEEPQVDEYGGYYDKDGYYRYPNGTYYDPQGNFFDGSGGYVDPQGNYHLPEIAKPKAEPQPEIVSESEAIKQPEASAQPEVVPQPEEEPAPADETVAEKETESEESTGKKKTASISSAERLAKLREKQDNKKSPGRKPATGTKKTTTAKTTTAKKTTASKKKAE